MLGLNLDCPLLLSTVIEHAATTFGDTELVSHSRLETVRGTYRDAALRSRRLAQFIAASGSGGRRVRRIARLEHASAF